MIKEKIRKEIITKHIKNRISQAQLAKEYGISKCTICEIIKKSGKKTPYFKKEKIDKDFVLKEYVEKRKSAVKISKELNVSVHPIYDILREAGVVRSFSECHIGHKAYNKGKRMSVEQRVKLSKKRKGKYLGKENPNWKGGKVRTSDDERRKSLEYKWWRRAVKDRDGWKCMECGEEDKRKLHSHHIKPVRNVDDIKLLTDINNGITLCKKCHYKTYLKEEKFEKFYKGLLEKAVNSGEVLTNNAEDNPERSSEGHKVSENVQRLESESQQ
jgi:DNA-binding XRE family transcriptional regulator